MRLLSRENEVIVFHRRRSFRKEVDSGALRMLLFLEHSGKKKQTTFARRDYHRHSPRDSGDSQKRRLFSSFFFFPSECVSLRLARFDARHASALLSFCPFSPAFPRKLRLRDACLDNEFLPLPFLKPLFSYNSFLFTLSYSEVRQRFCLAIIIPIKDFILLSSSFLPLERDTSWKKSRAILLRDLIGLSSNFT